MENLSAIVDSRKPDQSSRVFFSPACETLTRFFRRATFTGGEKLLPYANRFDAISSAAL